MESSAWVLMWEFYGQGYKGLSISQLNWFLGLGSDNLTLIGAHKSNILLRPYKTLPQCPPASQFVGSVLQMTDEMSDNLLVDEEDIEACYRDYFRNFVKCLYSEHPGLHQDWMTLFGVSPEFTPNPT